jgi:hypothetical protein
MASGTDRETRVTITEQPSFVDVRSWHPWGDEYLLPDHFSARLEGDWLPGHVHVDVAVGTSGVRCVAVRIEARRGEVITSHNLRAVPLKECLRLAAATMAKRGRAAGVDGVYRIEIGSPADPSVPLTLASRRPHRGVADEWLREVSDIYMRAEAVGEPPTRAVELEHSQAPIAYKTAARWVELARQRRDPQTDEPFLASRNSKEN